MLAAVQQLENVACPAAVMFLAAYGVEFRRLSRSAKGVGAVLLASMEDCVFRMRQGALTIFVRRLSTFSSRSVLERKARMIIGCQMESLGHAKLDASWFCALEPRARGAGTRIIGTNVVG